MLIQTEFLRSSEMWCMMISRRILNHSADYLLVLIFKAICTYLCFRDGKIELLQRFHSKEFPKLPYILSVEANLNINQITYFMSEKNLNPMYKPRQLISILCSDSTVL